MKTLTQDSAPLEVVFVLGSLHTAGPNLQLLYLIANLDRVEFRPTVLVTNPKKGRSPIRVELDGLGVEILECSGGRFLSIFRSVELLRQIKRKHPGVVFHPYGFRSDLICWLTGHRARLGNVRNNILRNYRGMFGYLRGTVIAKINLWLLKRCALVIACGEGVKADLATNKIDSVVVSNGIDSVIYNRLFISEEFSGFSDYAGITYLTCDSKNPGKNVTMLAKTFSKRDHNERRLFVMGDSKPDLVEEFESVPNVVFLGSLKRPGDALKSTDVFISASKHEGIPNAVLEALTLGRKVVLSDIPGHVDIVRSIGGDPSLLFHENESALQAAMESIESDLQAPTRYEIENLSATKMSEGYARVYRALSGFAPEA